MLRRALNGEGVASYELEWQVEALQPRKAEAGEVRRQNKAKAGSRSEAQEGKYRKKSVSIPFGGLSEAEIILEISGDQGVEHVPAIPFANSPFIF
jgi:hypothetical protein